jgi:hypothetical protein
MTASVVLVFNAVDSIISLRKLIGSISLEVGDVMVDIALVTGSVPGKGAVSDGSELSVENRFAWGSNITFELILFARMGESASQSKFYCWMITSEPRAGAEDIVCTSTLQAGSNCIEPLGPEI